MLAEEDRRIVRLLADGLPLVPRPYAALAARAGMTEEALLGRMRALRARGVLRRVGAVLQHRRAGFLANALCVWDVPEERLDAVGAAVSREEAVSHCYTRETAPGWPYNFYAMLHARDRAACGAAAARIARETGLGAPRVFYSVREWKKASMRYFDGP